MKKSFYVGLCYLAIMFEFLKKILGSAGEETIVLENDEVKDWLKKQVEEAEEKLEDELGRRLEKLKETAVSAENLIEELENAELHNKELPTKEIQIMEGNRMTYIRNSEGFLNTIA
jgi:hypothetical protein